MKKLTKMLMGAGLSLAFVASGAAAANATTSYPEGGTWNYGVKWGGGGQDFVYSDYFHGSRKHKASVCTTSGCSKTDWIAKGNWANAPWRVAGMWGNTAYYDVQ